MPTPISAGSSTARRQRIERRVETMTNDAAVAQTIPEGEIARRAYDLFVSRGAVHGHDVEHWLEAESDLRRMHASES
jgi:hypothetical protein